MKFINIFIILDVLIWKLKNSGRKLDKRSKNN